MTPLNPSDQTTAESQKYSAMLAEVERIITKINGDDLELDELVQHVESGYKMIQAMRARLTETKDKVEALREEFREEPRS